ncbi:MAG TPA: hypothetical protein VKT32_15275, partial [Chthonomonadaceae bacterium]|nr:hypothetical protein [Chthonomonadaceae bacterium]
ADGTTVESLTVDGAGNGNGNYRFVGIGYNSAGGTIQNVTVQNIEDTPFDGLQDGVAIYADTESGSSTLTVQNCTLQSYQKNGTVFAGAGLTVNMTGCTVTGAGPTNVIAQNGIEVYGAAGTISGNTFTGNTTDIYNGSPANFDMSNNTFDGSLPSTMTTAQLFALEDKIVHGPDNDNYGVVTVKANNLYVTDNSYDPPNTTSVKIQRAINVCSAGNIINLKPGVAFTDNVTINKPCTLSGPEAGVDPGLVAWPATGLTSITSADNATAPIIINADNVTVQGLVLNVPTSASISTDTSAVALADGRQGRAAATSDMNGVHVQYNEIVAGTTGDDHAGDGLFLALPNSATSQVFVEHNYLQIGAVAPTSAALFAKGGVGVSLTDDYYPSNAGSWVPYTTPDRVVVRYNTLRGHGKVYADEVLGARIDANNFGSSKRLPGATRASASVLNPVEIRSCNGVIVNGNLMQNAADAGILAQSVSGGTAENVVASCNTISGTLTRPAVAGVPANPGDPGAGIILGGVQNTQIVGNASTSNKGTGVVIAGNGYFHFSGVTVTSDPGANAINAGNLTGNAANIGINNRSAVTVDGTYNWWGATSGPAFGPGAVNGAVGAVTTSPYATVLSSCGDTAVSIAKSVPSYNPGTGRFDQTVTVKNTGTKNLWLPLFTVGSLNSHFQLYTPSRPVQTQYGTVAAGALSVPMTGPVLADLLAPGQSASLQLEFVQVQPGPISNLKYTADFLSGLLYP